MLSNVECKMTSQYVFQMQQWNVTEHLSLNLPFNSEDPSICRATILTQYVEALKEDITDEDVSGLLFKVL